MRLGTLGVAVSAVLFLFCTAVSARPSQDIFLDDVRRPVYRGKHRTRESKSDTAEVVVHGDISVLAGGEEISRGATVPTPTLGESLKTVTKQLLQDPTATDMVATDVRTPPRVKTRLEETGQGEVIPVIETTHQAIVSTPRQTPSPSVTPSPVTASGGLSTWILLSNGDQTTAIPSKKKPSSPTVPPTKKITNTARPTATIEKIIKKGNETKIEKLSAAVAAPLVATKKPSEPTAKPTIPYDSKFKNRTPVVVGRIPLDKTKVEPTKKVGTTQVPITTIDLKKKPTQISSIKNTVYIPDTVPTTSLLLESSTIGSGTGDGQSTTESSSKKTRRPSTKNKKKKNKIRRRKPATKEPPNALSKIDTDIAETKIEGFNRPLSTRIYNYLAREVMPNVGVGLVGLVLTAGLAGLLLYPFGTVVTRRNYEKTHTTPNANHMYYYNEYNPNNVDSGVVAQGDESVYGVNSNVNSYSPNYDSTKYGNHYRYDLPEYSNENVNGYAGIKDYSTLPDSVKGNQYSTLPENTKYYNMEPMNPISPQYKETETNSDKYTIDENKYPSLTEYTAYTSASAVGTNSGTYDNQPVNENEAPEKREEEDKEPHFSALSGAPNYSNTDFVGSVSVSGSYGAELGHRTGMLPMDHGPRSMKLEKRSKRDVNEILNEVDSDVPKENINTDETSSSLPETTTAQIKDVTNSVLSTESPELSTAQDATPYSYMPISTTSEKSTEEVKLQEILTNHFDISDNEITNRPYPVYTQDKNEVTTPQDETTTVSQQEEDFGLLALLRRLFQMKLRVGINLIRSTSEAFQRYLNRMSQRMEMAVKKFNGTPSDTNPSQRKKRDVSHYKKRKPIKKYNNKHH